MRGGCQGRDYSGHEYRGSFHQKCGRHSIRTVLIRAEGVASELLMTRSEFVKDGQIECQSKPGIMCHVSYLKAVGIVFV